MINDKSKLTDVEQIKSETPLKRTSGKDIINAPQAALTAQTGTPVGVDAAVIDNIRTRITEIETRLKALGFLL